MVIQKNGTNNTFELLSIRDDGNAVAVRSFRASEDAEGKLTIAVNNQSGFVYDLQLSKCENIDEATGGIQYSRLTPTGFAPKSLLARGVCVCLSK